MKSRLFKILLALSLIFIAVHGPDNNLYNNIRTVVIYPNTTLLHLALIGHFFLGAAALALLGSALDAN